MEGGFGYTPQQAAELTLDQVFMLLVDKDNLRSSSYAIKSVSSLEAMNLSKDGKIKGRTGDGKLIEAKVVGQSLCSRLNEEARLKAEADKKKAEEAKLPKRRKRGK